MASNKPSKEMIVVSFKEIPENICVETRFISKTTAQLNKLDNLYCMNMNQGHVEILPYDAFVANTQLQNLRTIRPLPHTVKNHNFASVPKTITFTPVVPNMSGQQTTFVAPTTSGQGVTFKTLPLPMSVPPYNTTHITSFPTTKPTTLMPLPTVTASFPSSISHSVPFGISPLLKTPVETRDTGCNTEPRPKYVEQEQQTAWAPSVTSVAIQCCIDEDFYEELLIGENEKSCDLLFTANQQSEEEEKEEFLQYVRDNSMDYKNHLRECLICGEVCKSSKYFYGHMAVHRGPKCLCFLCGQHLENDSLLKTHYCIGTQRKERALLRCPQKRCSVVAVSRLELYDHLNEHNDNRMHNCSACRKSFCTAQEFLRHLLLRAKCYTEAKRNRSRLYGLRTRPDRRCRVRVFTLHSHTRRTAMVKRPLSGRRAITHLCELCYRSYKSKYMYNCHVKKCAALLRKYTNRKNRSKNTRKN